MFQIGPTKCRNVIIIIRDVGLMPYVDDLILLKINAFKMFTQVILGVHEQNNQLGLCI